MGDSGSARSGSPPQQEWRTSFGIARPVEMLLRGGVSAGADRFRDVGMGLLVPCLVDVDPIWQPSLEVAVVDEVFARTAGAAIADAVGDVGVPRQVEGLIDLDDAQQGPDDG